MARDGAPSPACLAKEVFAQHVRHGDWVRFPERPDAIRDVDAIVAWTGEHRCGVFVHTAKGPRQLTISDWDDSLSQCRVVLKVDGSTGSRVVREPFDGTIRMDGYGVAVVTNASEESVAE